MKPLTTLAALLVGATANAADHRDEFRGNGATVITGGEDGTVVFTPSFERNGRPMDPAESGDQNKDGKEAGELLGNAAEVNALPDERPAL